MPPADRFQRVLQILLQVPAATRTGGLVGGASRAQGRTGQVSAVLCARRVRPRRTAAEPAQGRKEPGRRMQSAMRPHTEQTTYSAITVPRRVSRQGVRRHLAVRGRRLPIQLLRHLRPCRHLRLLPMQFQSRHLPRILHLLPHRLHVLAVWWRYMTRRHTPRNLTAGRKPAASWK